MELLIIRHAIAMDRGKFSEMESNDRLRPLTDKGRKRMERGARGLADLVPRVDLLATSPLTRARQTAEIVETHLEVGGSTVIEELVPSAHPADLLDWLETLDPRPGRVAVVGHEPHLSTLVSFLLTGDEDGLDVKVKKGSGVLLTLPRDLRPGLARLEWAVPPKALRGL